MIVKLQIKTAVEIQNKHKDARREALGAGDKQKFAQACSEMMKQLGKSKNGITLAVLDILSIEPELYEKTSSSIKDQPERQEEMKKTASEIEVTERTKCMGDDYEPLDKETALERIKAVEEKKAEHMVGIIIASKMGQFPPNQMAMGQEMAKIQAIDQVNKTTGLEESDIVIAFNKYNLGEDPAFHEILKGAQGKLNAKLMEA